MAKSNADGGRGRERDGGKWSGYGQQNNQPVYRSSFVNVSLSDADLEKIKAWCPDNDSMSSVLDAACEADYKVDVKWDAKFHCFTAILYPIGEDHKNAGLLLSGRGSTGTRAIRQAWYKSEVICDGVWGSFTEAQDKFSLND